MHRETWLSTWRLLTAITTRVAPSMALALLTPSALSQNVLSSFDSGTEGWTVLVNGGNGSVHAPMGGNPDGYLQTTDVTGGAYTNSAPLAFLGDLTGFDSGTFSFDGILIDQDGSAPLTQPGIVTFRSPTDSATKDLAPSGYSSTWTRYSAQLKAADWGKTQLQWSNLLANVTSIEIISDATMGNDTTGLDNVELAPLEIVGSLCNGDGGDQAGCVDCPCTNNSAVGTTGGCLNSAGTSTRIDATGDTSTSLPPGVPTDLRFSLAGAPAGALCVMLSGDAIAPMSMASMCFGLNSGTQAINLDGLRCAIVNTRRHGGRSANAQGEVMDSSGASRVWGGEAQPNSGLWAQGGFVAGQTRYFQVTHREDPLLGCMRGLNTSQAIEILFTP